MVTQSATRTRSDFASANGRRRAAAFLIALGPELAADIMRTLPEEDISQLTWEIVGIGSLTQKEREDIMSTFYEALVGRDFVSVGGLEYAQDMLERAMGKDRADEIVTKLSAHTGARPFQFLHQVHPKDLVNFIQTEHPQVVALILAYLPTEVASALLQKLPEDTQAEVAVRLAMMERTSPEVLEDIESAMRARLGTVFAPRQDITAAGGIDAVVELILRKVDLQTEKVDPRRPGEDRPRYRQPDQEADVRLRQHYAARRPLDPARVARGRQPRTWAWR